MKDLLLSPHEKEELKKKRIRYIRPSKSLTLSAEDRPHDDSVSMDGEVDEPDDPRSQSSEIEAKTSQKETFHKRKQSTNAVAHGIDENELTPSPRDVLHKTNTEKHHHDLLAGIDELGSSSGPKGK